MQSLRSAVIELRNFLLIRGFKGKATVFQEDAFEIRLRRKNSQDPQVLARRILADARLALSEPSESKGEVAERLKAAVC